MTACFTNEMLLCKKRLAGRERAWCHEVALEQSGTLQGPFNKIRYASKEKKLFIAGADQH